MSLEEDIEQIKATMIEILEEIQQRNIILTERVKLFPIGQGNEGEIFYFSLGSRSEGYVFVTDADWNSATINRLGFLRERGKDTVGIQAIKQGTYDENIKFYLTHGILDSEEAREPERFGYWLTPKRILTPPFLRETTEEKLRQYIKPTG